MGLLAGQVLAWVVVALATASSPQAPAPSDLSESSLNAAGLPRRGGPQAVVSELKPSGEPERSTNLATSQLASSIQFQVCDRLSFTGKFKFVIAASHLESLRSHVFGTSVSSSLSPLVPSRFILASSARWASVESAACDGNGRGDAAGVQVCRAALVATLLGPLAELDNVSRASRQCPWRLTARQSRQPSVAAMAHGDRPSVTVAQVVSTPIQVMPRAGCRQRRPSVPTATHWPFVAV